MPWTRDVLIVAPSSEVPLVMSLSSPCGVRRLVALAAFPLLSAAVVMVALSPGAAQAQACTSVDPPCPPDEPPEVGFVPSDGSFTSSALEVTIRATDDIELDVASWQVTLNGSDVTSSFGLTGPTYSMSAKQVVSRGMPSPDGIRQNALQRGRWWLLEHSRRLLADCSRKKRISRRGLGAAYVYCCLGD